MRETPHAMIVSVTDLKRPVHATVLTTFDVQRSQQNIRTVVQARKPLRLHATALTTLDN